MFLKFNFIVFKKIITFYYITFTLHFILLLLFSKITDSLGNLLKPIILCYSVVFFSKFFSECLIWILHYIIVKKKITFSSRSRLKYSTLWSRPSWSKFFSFFLLCLVSHKLFFTFTMFFCLRLIINIKVIFFNFNRFFLHTY